MKKHDIETPYVSFTHYKKKFRLIGIFLFLLPLLSCSFKKTTIVDSGFSTGEFKASAYSFIGEDDIFSALAQINVFTTKSFYPLKAALTLKRPSYLRLELLPVIGVPDFFLTASPEILKIFIPSKGEAYSGQPTISNLEKFLPWPIEIEDMIMIFTGTYPLFKESNILYQAHRENNYLVVEMNSSSGASQIVWVGENNKLLKLVRKDEGGEELYNVKYSYNNDHRNFPEKITINITNETTSLSVRYSDIKIEKAKDLSVFDLTIPDDVKEIILE
ncbi:MAG: DUF4292 domain-containing protein [Syntrophaceae bacterium]|nr:DUF4292 domain-containing protein [Syntrophaceae bacterium]